MEQQIEKELTLRDLILIHQRRHKIIYGAVLIFFTLAALYCAVCTRRYEATGTVEVQKESSDMMGLESMMSGAEGGATDALDANIDIQTQTNILQSDTLAIQTIKALNMEGTYDFKPRFSLVVWVLAILSPNVASDAPGVPIEDAPLRRARALKIFQKNLTVKPVSGTRLIEIDYKSPDPKLAAEVVNALAKELDNYTFQTRYDATTQASKWLSDQMGELRKASEDSQAQVVNLQRESGVYSLGTTDSDGREQAYSGVLDQLQQVTTALTVAEQNRILKGAIAHAAETGDAEMLSGLAGNAIGGTSAGMNNSLSLIQSLRGQETTEQAALQEAKAKYGSSYPKLAEIEGNITAIDRSIQAEIGRIRLRAKSDYDVATQAEASTRAQYDTAKQQADVLNDKAIQYTIAKEEAEESRTLYEDLLKKLNEAGVLAGLQSSNITIVDPGRTPAKPVKPNIPIYLLVALAAGWVLGCCGALIVDTLDNKINIVSDIEEVTGTTVAGVLPQVQDKTCSLEAPRIDVITDDDPRAPYTEALRALRTSILLSQPDSPPKVILVTSSLEGEGKSTAALNLAYTLAQTGRKTLLVDTDLRRGTLSRRLGIPKRSGLSDLLAGRSEDAPIQQVSEVANLDALGAGNSSPNPSELLCSEAIRTWLKRWREQYDFIVLDSAPVLPVTDTVTLNTLADVTLILARSGVTEKPQIVRSYNMLRRNGEHYVGLVLNGLSLSDHSYYGYYGYGKNGYSYVHGGKTL